MTKVTKLFDNSRNDKDLKPIEFAQQVENDSYDEFSKDNLTHTSDTPSDWQNVKLIAKGVKFDIIAAWNGDDETDVVVYFGHWNDGVVK